MQNTEGTIFCRITSEFSIGDDYGSYIINIEHLYSGFFYLDARDRKSLHQSKLSTAKFQCLVNLVTNK